MIIDRRIRREFVEDEAELSADEYVGSKPDDLSEVDPKLLAALDDAPERQKLQQMLQEERDGRNILSIHNHHSIIISLCLEWSLILITILREQVRGLLI